MIYLLLKESLATLADKNHIISNLFEQLNHPTL